MKVGEVRLFEGMPLSPHTHLVALGSPGTLWRQEGRVRVGVGVSPTSQQCCQGPGTQSCPKSKGVHPAKDPDWMWGPKPC